MNPLTIYLLAIVFRVHSSERFVARAFAAFWMFAACLLLGVLAKRISGQLKVGIIVAGTALLTPWFFEIGRLVFDAHFSAFTVVLFLLAAYRIQSKETWSWRDITMVAGSLALVTYGYFSGRVLGAFVRAWTYSSLRPRSTVSLACSRSGLPTGSRWYHLFCSIGRILAC